jgi:predicted phosphodiesterase
MTIFGILSDAHGHLAGFNKALFHLKRLGAEKFVYLGDSIGYIPDVSVARSLRSEHPDIICVRGNHEEMLLANNTDIYQSEIYQLETIRSLLTEVDLAYLRSWPSEYEVILNGHRIQYIHGSPDDHVNGYVYPETDLSRYPLDHDIVFMANSHRPFIRKEQSVRYVNVGSCGMPRDDGRYGSAALLDSESSDIRIVRFDITNSTTALLANFPVVHASVREIYLRRSIDIVGDIL